MTSYNVPLSRRAFLVTTTAAGISLASTSTQASPTIRAGLIGYGDVGKSLFQQASSVDLPVDIVAVAERDAHQLSSLPRSIERLSAWESLVSNPNIDAILIATPDHLLTPIAQRALDGEKKVFLVPPFAGDLAATSLLRQALEQGNGRLHLAADQAARAHWAACRSAYTQLENRAPRWIEADLRVDGVRPAGHWSLERAGSRGDAATTIFNHLCAVSEAFSLGLPLRATAFGGVFGSTERETPDTLSFHAEYEDGLRLSLNIRQDATAPRTTIVRGQTAHIAMPAPASHVEFALAPWTEEVHKRTISAEATTVNTLALLECVGQVTDRLVGRDG